MMQQPGSPSSLRRYECLFFACKPRRESSAESTYEHGEGDQAVRLTVRKIAPDKYHWLYEFLGLKACSISIHQDAFSHSGRNDYDFEHIEMSGKIGDVFWRGYDPADGHGKQKIFEEWLKSGAPDDKTAIIQDWFQSCIRDQRWRDLGGRPWANLHELVLEYDLGEWMDGETLPEQACGYR